MISPRFVSAAVLAALFAAVPAARADVLDDDLAAAKTLLLAGNVDDAAARLDSLEARARVSASVNPGDAHLQYILGMAAMYAGHDPVAKSALGMAVRLAPGNITYIMGRAQLALYTGAPGDAVKWLQDALPQNPRNLELLDMLGQAQQKNAQFADAQQTFQKAAALAPAEPRYLAECAECQLSLHKPDEALATYQKALEVNPRYTLALANIGQIYQTRHDNDKAIAAYTQLLAIDPADYRAMAKLVQLNQAAGNIKQRDAARDQIFAVYKARKIDAASYCREQFTVGKTPVMAYESFELTGPQAVRYAFDLLTADGTKVDKRLSLGSYLQATALARELGQIPPDQRMFHLDVYTDNGHETLGMFTKEPTYEETRAMVEQYVAGKLKPMPTTSTAPAASQPANPAGGAP